MSEASKEASPGIVRDLFDPSPSLRFDLKRKQEDGSVKAWPFRCRLLRVEQVHEAIIAAQKYAKGKELEGYGDVYREAQACEILQRAICDVETGEREEGGRTKRWLRPKFTSTEQLRMSLDESECAQMLNCYELTKAHFKVTDDLEPEQVERIIDGLADEMAGPYFLGQWDSSEWPRLIFSLARLAQSWRPANGGPTPSSSESSSESSPLSSESGTTDFSELPSVQSVELPNVSLPTDKVLTRDEAREIVKRQQGDAADE